MQSGRRGSQEKERKGACQRQGEEKEEPLGAPLLGMRLAQSTRRTLASVQASCPSALISAPSSKLAVIETKQSLSFGSLILAFAPGASGLGSRATTCDPEITSIEVAFTARALVTVSVAGT